MRVASGGASSAGISACDMRIGTSSSPSPTLSACPPSRASPDGAGASVLGAAGGASFAAARSCTSTSICCRCIPQSLRSAFDGAHLRGTAWRGGVEGWSESVERRASSV